eukprot:scaffold3132_cov158-Amphora_coffeaeformis.AAC.6
MLFFIGLVQFKCLKTDRHFRSRSEDTVTIPTPIRFFSSLCSLSPLSHKSTEIDPGPSNRIITSPRVFEIVNPSAYHNLRYERVSKPHVIRLNQSIVLRVHAASVPAVVASTGASSHWSTKQPFRKT